MVFLLIARLVGNHERTLRLVAPTVATERDESPAVNEGKCNTALAPVGAVGDLSLS